MTTVVDCPSCGEKFQFVGYVAQFVCGNCGSEYAIKYNGGKVILVFTVDRAEHTLDMNLIAIELSILRLQKDIIDLEEERWDLNAENDTPLYLSGIMCLFVTLVAFGYEAVEFGLLFGIPSSLMFSVGIGSGLARRRRKKAIASEVYRKKNQIERRNISIK